jgi:hypothetical protein
VGIDDGRQKRRIGETGKADADQASAECRQDGTPCHPGIMMVPIGFVRGSVGHGKSLSDKCLREYATRYIIKTELL